MHSDGNTGGRMKKWVVFYGVPLALWTWLSWGHLRTASHKALSPPPSAGRDYRPPWWGSDLAVALGLGAGVVVLLLVLGLVQGKLRIGPGRLAPARSYLLGCAAAWLGLSMAAAAFVCELGFLRAALAFVLAIPAVVVMAMFTPAKVGPGWSTMH